MALFPNLVEVPVDTITWAYLFTELPLTPPDRLDGHRIVKMCYVPYISVDCVKNENIAALSPLVRNKMPLPKKPTHLPAPLRFSGERIEHLPRLEQVCYEYVAKWEPGCIDCSSAYFEFDVEGIDLTGSSNSGDHNAKALYNVYRYCDIPGIRIQTSNRQLTHGRGGQLFCRFEYHEGGTHTGYLPSNDLARIAFTPKGHLAFSVGRYPSLSDYFNRLGYGDPSYIDHKSTDS